MSVSPEKQKADSAVVAKGESLYTAILDPTEQKELKMPQTTPAEIEAKVKAELKTADELEKVAEYDIGNSGGFDSVGTLSKPDVSTTQRTFFTESAYDRRLRAIRDVLVADAARLRALLILIDVRVKDLVQEQKIFEGATGETNIRRAVRPIKAYLDALTRGRRGKTAGRRGGVASEEAQKA